MPQGRRRLAGEAGRGWPAGELLWGERVPFPGSIGAGEGWMWELDGAGTAGGHGGRLWTPWKARPGAWSREESRGGDRRLACEAKGREESRAEGASEQRSGARHGSARSSPWHVDGHPRRACREMAPRGEAEKLRENQGRGAARARRVAGGLDSVGAEQGRVRENRV